MSESEQCEKQQAMTMGLGDSARAEAIGFHEQERRAMRDMMAERFENMPLPQQGAKMSETGLMVENARLRNALRAIRTAIPPKLAQCDQRLHEAVKAVANALGDPCSDVPAQQVMAEQVGAREAARGRTMNCSELTVTAKGFEIRMNGFSEAIHTNWKQLQACVADVASVDKRTRLLENQMADTRTWVAERAKDLNEVRDALHMNHKGLIVPTLVQRFESLQQTVSDLRAAHDMLRGNTENHSAFLNAEVGQAVERSDAASADTRARLLELERIVSRLPWELRRP